MKLEIKSKHDWLLYNITEIVKFNKNSIIIKSYITHSIPNRQIIKVRFQKKTIEFSVSNFEITYLLLICNEEGYQLLMKCDFLINKKEIYYIWKWLMDE